MPAPFFRSVGGSVRGSKVGSDGVPLAVMGPVYQRPIGCTLSGAENARGRVDLRSCSSRLRLLVTVGIVLVFAAFYFRFLK
jgi:hypothetical protein